MSDPSTDSIVSWTANGRTFTVWNPDMMEKEQLPNTFKHSNFASFVRQLNNYGFRKCHSDRFEFGVEGFERGKPELLTTLKRHDAPRSKKTTSIAKGGTAAKGKSNNGASGSGAVANGKTRGPPSQRHLREGSPSHGAQSLELGAYGGVTNEVEQLKRDRLLLLKEVMRLREQQDSTADEVRRLSSRLQSTEQFQSTMLSFVEQVRDSGGNLSNLSFDGFNGLMDMTGVAVNETRGVPRKRRQMYLPSVPVSNSMVSGSDTEMRLANASGVVSATSSIAIGASPVNPGMNAGMGNYHPNSASLADRFQEIEDEDYEAPIIDDALTNQMFGPLSPNPRAAIQLPEHEGWLEEFAANEMNNGNGNTGGMGGPGIPNGTSRAQPDTFVSSILERGPSLEKQLSLGFLDSMNSAEIGEMVRDMNIGNRNGNAQDEVAARFEALNPN